MAPPLAEYYRMRTPAGKPVSPEPRMTRFEKPRVAVIGAGDIGCGWAALAVSAGWPVAVYDTDSVVLQRAAERVRTRVAALVGLGRADDLVAEDALHQMRIGRSLLQTVNDADWIIESTTDTLATKQRLLEQIEQVCRLHAVVTSSTLTHHASDLCARLRRPERLLAANPLAPVEFLPVVEVIPGPRTDPACVEDVRFWLSMLGRAPVVLKKEIPGNAVTRIQAAVWRECILLALEGVVDLEDLDTILEQGPALAWTAAGPFLTAHLMSAEAGPEIFLSELLNGLEETWAHLASWQKLPAEDKHRLIRMIERVNPGEDGGTRDVRSSRLARLLAVLGPGHESPG
jgi:3-hydroxyacyl-CoA dehydrogenase